MRTASIFLSGLLLIIFAWYTADTIRGRRAAPSNNQKTALNTLTLSSPSPVDPADPVRGQARAAHTLIEFGDFSCEACRAAEPVLRALLAERRDLKLVWRDLPLQGTHPFARRAALSARCAQDQNRFWEYHDMLLGRTDILSDSALSDTARGVKLDEARFAQCLAEGTRAAVVEKNVAEASALGVRGVPEFYLDGVRYDGPHTIDGFKKALDLSPNKFLN